MITWISALLKAAIEGVYSIFRKEKDIADNKSKEATEKALGSVGESIRVEEKIRENNDKKEVKNEVNNNGGINFDSWNSGK